MKNKEEKIKPYAVLTVSEDLLDHGYSCEEEYLQVKGKNLSSAAVGTFYSEHIDELGNRLLHFFSTSDIDMLISEYYISNSVDIEKIREYEHSGDFHKSYEDVMSFLSDKLFGTHASMSSSMDLARHIEKYVFENKLDIKINVHNDSNNFASTTIYPGDATSIGESVAKSKHYCDECKQELGEIACSNKDGGSFCSAACEGKSYQRNHGGNTDYYNIPEWATDIDTLSEAWNLSSHEFNAIKSIFGASRIRQGLKGRHSASNDDPERDFNKAITYTSKMLVAFHRSNS